MVNSTSRLPSSDFGSTGLWTRSIQDNSLSAMIGCFGLPIHGTAKDTPKTLAVTLALPPDLLKIIKKRSQGVTPEYRTLPLPNFAGCNTTTSHPATLAHRTLRPRATTPCHFRLSHSATFKARFCPLNPTLRVIVPRHSHPALMFFDSLPILALIQSLIAPLWRPIAKFSAARVQQLRQKRVAAFVQMYI